MAIRRKPSNPKFTPSQFISLAMAAITLVAVFFLILFFSISSATHRHHHHSTSEPATSDPIRLACQAARFPDACVSPLAGSGRIPPEPKPIEIISTAVSLTSEGLARGVAMVESILTASVGNTNRTSAGMSCLETLGKAVYRTELTAEALPAGKIEDAIVWLSGVHQYIYGCWSGLSYVNGTKEVDGTMSFLDNLLKLSSNTLGMVNAYYSRGDDLASWAPPKTERDGYWASTRSAGPKGPKLYSPDPTGLPANATVCKGKSGMCYPTVQAAVNTASANETTPFVIKINHGVYRETVRISLEKRHIVLLGDGMGKTVITGSSKVGPGVTTYNTATVGVLGDGFIAKGITFENNAPPETRQAVAFRSDSDMSLIEDCEFLGNQDTLYAQSMRQYYRNNRIEGNVDFIFGNAAVVFENCTILVRPRQVRPEKGETNAVTANGRTDPGERTGFVFKSCIVNGTDEYMKLYNNNPQAHKNFLGRPWKEYSRTVFIGCSLGEIINPDGWLPWKGDFALRTLYYGEFENYGTGANTSIRVWWSNLIPPEHVDVYSLQNFLQLDRWPF